jgi:hypothetical protein
MIQWYREGKFPLEEFVQYFDVSATTTAFLANLLTSKIGGRLPGSTPKPERGKRDQAGPDLEKLEHHGTPSLRAECQ